MGAAVAPPSVAPCATTFAATTCLASENWLVRSAHGSLADALASRSSTVAGTTEGPRGRPVPLHHGLTECASRLDHCSPCPSPALQRLSSFSCPCPFARQERPLAPRAARKLRPGEEEAPAGASAPAQSSAQAPAQVSARLSASAAGPRVVHVDPSARSGPVARAVRTYRAGRATVTPAVGASWAAPRLSARPL